MELTQPYLSVRLLRTQPFVYGFAMLMVASSTRLLPVTSHTRKCWARDTLH